MHDLPCLLHSSWQRIGQQMDRLMTGLPASCVVDQSHGVANHPAWTLSHLCHYHPAILSILTGQPVMDPALALKAELYDEGSTPVADAKAYLPWDELVDHYHSGHASIAQALTQTTPAILSGSPGLDRWNQAFANAADALMYLMVMHESQHAGQFMAWRRASGLALT